MTSPAPRLTVYLDHAAATPMVPVAIEAMNKVFSTVGNASSLHGSGRKARRLVEESREVIAALLGARPSEVIFTSGGTESDNLAVKGIFWARRRDNPARTHIIASSVEHHAVIDAVSWLQSHEGATVTWLPVTSEGTVEPQQLREALETYADRTALISIMWANNEVGTINPVSELAAVAAEFDIPIHTDAIAATGYIPVDFAASGMSALSLAAHKFGGPHGAGVLLLRRDVACVPLQHGGGHERDIRSGTADVAAIVGMAAALDYTVTAMPHASKMMSALRADLVDRVSAIADGVVFNGAKGEHRLPGNAHFTFLGCEGDSLLMLLDARGIECSTGSACTAGVASASHVLTAMGMDPAVARGSLRFSLGHSSVLDDVEALVEVLPHVLERARAAALASAGMGSRVTEPKGGK
ncbi:MAG: cysteine desulfurase family protein [Mycobacteriaceae bacterium]